MGLFDFLKGKKTEPSEKEEELLPLLPFIPTPSPRQETSKEIVPRKPNPPALFFGDFKIHEDIKNLLWFGDGPLKNLTKEQMASDKDVFHLQGIKVTVSFGLSIDEPSLIYIKAPVNKPQNESVIPRPPYFPKYKDLTPEQRWIYLKLLTNPYNVEIDIGYVFILYYGLERHLLQGDFDSAFKVILKLRDVHKNKSFQSYSGNALILSALSKNKGEYIPLFINSLDKEYEFGFSDNLFLMSFFSFNVPLLPKDIMRMAKTFDFTNMNYIKKNPDIFEKCLSDIIKEKTGSENMDLKNYFNADSLQKIKYGQTTIFCNSSIIGNTVPVPLLADNPKLKKEMNGLLLSTHENVKTKLAEMRKAGTLKENIEPTEKIRKPVMHGPPDQYLLEKPKAKTIWELHSFYMNQIRAFYLRRDEDEKYLPMAITACENDISISKKVVEDWKKEINDALPSHPGYQQLCIIREKEEKWQEVIRLAEQAKSEGWAGDWDKRIEKARKKLESMPK